MRRSFLPWLIVGLVWYAGVSRGWWTPGWLSYVVAGVSALVLSRFERVGAHAKLPPPSPAAVQVEVARLSDAPQRRSLRHLRYRVAAEWDNQRADEGVWTGVKFLVGDFMIARYAASPIIDKENLSAEMIQSFAISQYQQEGARVTRNEISDLDGHPCVITEAETRRYKERRISFTVHASEYLVRFTCDSAEHFERSRPVMDALAAACEIVLPPLATQIVLGGRVGIGIPAGWTPTGNEPRLARWRASPGPLDMKLHLLDYQTPGELTPEVFSHVPGLTSRPNAMVNPYWMMASEKLRVLRMAAYVPPMHAEWALDAIRLPSGSVVVLETEHKGPNTDEWHYLLLEPMRHALLASIKDADVPVI
jgi:hypothetical protein